MLSLIINKSTEKLSKCKHIALLVLADMFFYLTSWRMLIWATNTILMSLVDTTEDQTNNILYF